jgi:hypothetical protein
MPKGPQGQKRPADAVANAIRVAKILTAEIDERYGRFGQGSCRPSAREGGGASRRERLSPEQRAEIARQAAAKRWGT